MPKYQYPSYVYDRNTARKGATSSLIDEGGDGLISTTEEERKAFLGEGPSSGMVSSEEDEESDDCDGQDFFSNAEFLRQGASAYEKKKWAPTTDNAGGAAIKVKEGSAYIEGGGSY